jgi:hypothetical protein
MADLNITTDFSQVNNLNTALKSTDTLFVKVVLGLTREAQNAARVTKMFAETTQKNLDLISKAEVLTASKVQQESDKRDKARIREADRTEKNAKRIIAANEKVARSEALLAQEILRNQTAAAQRSTAGLNQRVGVTGPSAMASGAGFGALDGEVERLRMKYDQIYASSQLYERSLNELNVANRIGALSTAKHEAAVESLNMEYQQFSSGVVTAGNRFSQHVNQSATGMNRMGMVAQQTGYQVSDFVVQIQGGTNPLVAFSQQATQLAGLLYYLPPALQSARIGVLGFSVAMSTAFAGVTILIPLLSMLAMAFFRSGKEAKEAADGPIKDAEEGIKALDASLKAFMLTKKLSSLGITGDQLISQDGLKDAEAALKKIEETYTMGFKLRLRQGRQQPREMNDTEIRSMGEDPAVKAAREAVVKAEGRVAGVGEQIAKAYDDQLRSLTDIYNLDINRMVLGEDSLAFKKMEADVALSSYEQQLRDSKTLSDDEIKKLVDVRKNQEEELRLQEIRLVGTKNQTDLDRARAQERLANEQTYQAAIDKTVAKNQYWSDQAKAAERQAVAVEYIVKNLTLLGVSKDADGFNKAMQGALDSGVQFSMLDLSSVVALAARNGWDLTASLSAAWAMARQSSPAAASIAMGAGGRPDINLDDNKYRGAAIQARLSIAQKARDDAGGASGGGGSATEATQTAIEKLLEQLAVEKELLGTSEAYQRVRTALGDDFKNTSPQVVAGLVAQVEQVESLIELEERRKDVMDTVKSSMEDAFMSMVDGTKSAKEAFKDMARSIIEELYRVLVVQQLVNGISGFLAPGGTPAPTSSIRSQPNPHRASGGSMMPNQSYLVGEHGPELVMPRHSGTVVNANQTGSMGGPTSQTVNNNISVVGSDAAAVRREIAKMVPQIVQATKAAMIDSKRRGGRMASAFK